MRRQSKYLACQTCNIQPEQNLDNKAIIQILASSKTINFQVFFQVFSFFQIIKYKKVIEFYLYYIFCFYQDNEFTIEVVVVDSQNLFQNIKKFLLKSTHLHLVIFKETHLRYRKSCIFILLLDKSKSSIDIRNALW